MKSPLSVYFAAMIAIVACSVSHAVASEDWVTNFEAAKTTAEKESKDLLVEFTGSDWCPPCKELNARVLSKDAFLEPAQQKYVLVKLDYPNDKTLVSEEVVEQNKRLMEIYPPSGFPSILLMDKKGRPFGKTGFRPGTPEEFVAHLAELQENKTARDIDFAKAADAEGVTKAKALYAGLQHVPEKEWVHYKETMESIRKNDPDDESGFEAEETRKIALAKAKKELQVKMRGLKDRLDEAMKADDIEKSFDVIDGFIAKEKLEGELKQSALGMKYNIAMRGSDNDILEGVLDEIIAADPESDFSEQAKAFKENQLKVRREAASEKSSPEPEPTDGE